MALRPGWTSPACRHRIATPVPRSCAWARRTIPRASPPAAKCTALGSARSTEAGTSDETSGGFAGVEYSEVASSGAPEASRLVRLARPDRDGVARLLVFLPGSDGTGQSIVTQLPTLRAAGYEVWTLCLPPANRCGWERLTNELVAMLRALATEWSKGGPSATPATVTLLGESFGGCLGLRAACAAPDLLERLVLINPATCYNDSMGGLSALVSSTNLLGLFPQQLYNVAQETLLPLLVDSKRVTPTNVELLKRMITMQPAGATRTPGSARRVLRRDTIRTTRSSSGGGGGGGGSASAPMSVLSAVAATVAAPLGGGGYVPAAAANHRTNLLREGNLPDAELRAMHVQTLILSSGRDRLLPSIQEGARLASLLPASKRVILPDSSHTALLERGIDLAALLEQHTHAGGSAASAALPPRHGARRRVVPSTTTTTPITTMGAAPDVAPQRLPDSAPDAGPSSLDASSSSGMPTPAAPTRMPQGGEDQFATWAQRLAPWRDLVSPVVMSVDRLPPVGSPEYERPMLFVGNHGKMGLYDCPLLLYELFLRGYRVRGLAHPGHWRSPVGAFFESFGAVKASPMAAFRLLRNNEKVLLFPGGASEVVKPRGQEYRLLWKDDRPDFVRLAARCNAIIIPFAAVGADDAYDVMMEVDEQLQLPLIGDAIKYTLGRVGSELNPRESIFPLTRLPGLGLPSIIPVPNLTRLYFKFGSPVDLYKVQLDVNDDVACQALYNDIRTGIEADLAELQEIQASDDERDVSSRVGNTVSSFLPFMQRVDDQLQTDNTNNANGE